MANLKDIQRQIKSVKNTQKTTRAMKLVSTAKLRRSEELAKKSKVYAQKLGDVINDIAQEIHQHKVGGFDSRFFAPIEKVSRVDIVFVTADKGLCGGFNVQTIKAVKRLMDEYKSQNVKVRLRAIGKKGIEYFKFNDIELLDAVNDLSSSPTPERAADFIKGALSDFEDGYTDKVILVHNGYLNMLTQVVRINDLFPIDVSSFPAKEANASMIEVEPEEDESVLNDLIKKYVEFTMFYSLIDSLAAEHSARMQAMDAATNNAKEMVNQLTVKYNKARQESITTELIEIISGMEAMN